MERVGVLELIADSPKAHGVFSVPEETSRTVFCTIKSVMYKEHYDALAHGLNPTIVFVLACDADYEGEKKCRYDDVSYHITRTYLTASGGIELTAERIEEQDA